MKSMINHPYTQRYIRQKTQWHYKPLKIIINNANYKQFQTIFNNYRQPSK